MTTTAMNVELDNEERIKNEKAKKMLMYIGIVSMVMAFAGLTSAYVVRQAQDNWMHFELPQMFWISSALILISSVTMNWAVSLAKKGNFDKVKLAALLTFVLGIGFTISQFMGWSSLYNSNVVFAGRESNASGSFMYVLTGLHLAHLFAGLIALIFVIVKSHLKKYTIENHLGIKIVAIFWHFLDILWIYLFLFLLFIR